MARYLKSPREPNHILTSVKQNTESNKNLAIRIRDAKRVAKDLSNSMLEIRDARLHSIVRLLAQICDSFNRLPCCEQMTSIDIPDLGNTAEGLAPSIPTEDGDLQTRITSILTCYYELQGLLASCGRHEDAIIKAETLGEAIRAVLWRAHSLKDIIAMHKQDVPHLLEAMQMVWELSQRP
jgi:hypothetical protein